MSHSDTNNEETLPLSPDCVQKKISEGIYERSYQILIWKLKHKGSTTLLSMPSKSQTILTRGIPPSLQKQIADQYVVFATPIPV